LSFENFKDINWVIPVLLAHPHSIVILVQIHNTSFLMMDRLRAAVYIISPGVWA